MTAPEPTGAALAPAATSFVAVRVGTLRLVVPLTDTVEIVRMVETMPVPDAGEPVCGVIDYRGVIIPVVDPAARLGQAVRPPCAASKLVIAQHAGRLVAILVDDVEGLVDVEPDRLVAHGTLFPAGARAGACTRGTVRLEEGLALELDVTSLVEAVPA